MSGVCGGRRGDCCLRGPLTRPAPFLTLLPLGALALAALAVPVRGWELGVRSGYLPHGMLGSPEALRRAEGAGGSDLGHWTAK
ncbi:Imm49 family immunity protein [Streptomyces mirabilis]|uniref:Imm49 family immunity protein n=1 Tax=Streptomyces mirabilis TaxID=68239 RepID=UPI0035715B1B